jgi:hypothetical protein
VSRGEALPTRLRERYTTILTLTPQKDNIVADLSLIEQDLEKQILATQQRFQTAMQARLAYMSLETKERYFAVLSLLAAKLEDPHKPLREVLQEVVIESAPYIAQELSSS